MADEPQAQPEQASEPAAAQAPAPAAAESLLTDIADATGVSKKSGARGVVERAIGELVQYIARPEVTVDRVDKNLVDAFIGEIDKKLGAQVDAILHNKEFQDVESAWRGLKLVIDKVDFRQNIRVHLVNCSKDDMIADFEDAPEIPKSGLYRQIYTNEFGQFGGEPFGTMIANYDFGPSSQDMALLQKVASVGAMSHCPFIAAGSPKFFGADDFLSLPNMKDLKAHFEAPSTSSGSPSASPMIPETSP